MSTRAIDLGDGWVKSGFSTGANTGCVIARSAPGATDGSVQLGDSKNGVGQGPINNFTQHEWSVFVEGVKAGHFDYLLA